MNEYVGHMVPTNIRWRYPIHERCRFACYAIAAKVHAHTWRYESASAVGHEAADVKGWGTTRDGSAGLRLRRPRALERVHLLLEEWQHAGRLADTEARMLRVLD